MLASTRIMESPITAKEIESGISAGYRHFFRVASLPLPRSMSGIIEAFWTATAAIGRAISFSHPVHVVFGTTPNLTYLPNTNFHGKDSFSFRVNDGTNTSASATVSITILQGANTAPVASSQNLTNAEDTTLLITLSGAASGVVRKCNSVAALPVTVNTRSMTLVLER